MFGQSTTDRFGGGTPASADGTPEYKVAGVTLDTATVPAADVADVTLDDDSIIPAGHQYLPYGAILCKITASGKYGPHDPAAADGREDLEAGEVVILNYTMRDDDLQWDNPPGVFEGGRVYRDRVKRLNAGAWEAGWTPELQQACPRLVPVDV